ncbi:hypothetical protein SEA_IKELOA_26 [Mycobacterium phage IkeLoa]|uniref:Uncharacterized protein n=3 Tax=Bixzunavirus TaxID=680114 RepID=A0A411CCI9_9CAUD|nr:hypothetical protein MOMOMIXON_31 [Mycobacterium phage MoMoMixon]YP_010056984.1 hypothetical protein KHO58_gp036 [Mycobacterium phage Bigswole]YP_010057903.1 hypothetical protein KHO62_gp029 [Mycobacterium phage NoodleTree]AVJ48544.1 hypothetical protein SEA_PIER_32 [Mycobacterium phage Pier]QAX95070.1 hypothetical protein SEA_DRPHINKDADDY_30 [Mycobacterium phage DrPhinkDaddy]QAY08139.1 hypothetical protein SEA_KAMRYN_30 [Mycobacterium phage Kamryn]QAY12591.1 hypothetical protein SEA_NIDHO
MTYLTVRIDPLTSPFCPDHLSRMIRQLELSGVPGSTPIELWGRGAELALVSADTSLYLREQGWTLLVDMHGLVNPVGVRAADQAKARAQASKKTTTTRRGPIGWFQRHWNGEAFKEKESS